MLPVPHNGKDKYHRSFGKNRNLTWKKSKEKIEAIGKRGDYHFIQFGSNDKKMYKSEDRIYASFKDKEIHSPEIEQDFKNDLKFYVD